LGTDKLGLQEWARARDENIHLKHALTVNDVKTGIILNGVDNHLFVHIKFFLQG